jgi:hypothetical protein
MYAALALALVLGLSPMVDATTAYEEDANPLTLGPSTITDRQGNLIFTDETDPAEAFEDTEFIGVGAGSPAQTFATSGVYNADFQLPPPNRDAILQGADLPYWRLVTGADPSITYQHVDSAASPSGKAIRATITGGVVDDEAMFEQIIPVSPRQRLKLPILRSTVGADADTGAEIRIQYFKVDGSSTGSESSGALDPAFLDPQDVYALAGIPADARFARVRFGVVLTGTVASDTIDFHEVWVGVPHISYETWTFSGVSLTGTGSAALDAVNTTGSGSTGALAAYHTTPDAGQGTIAWVESITVALSTNRTAGDVEFQLSLLGGSPLGPIATIDATNTNQAWATANLLDTTDLLFPEQRYSILAVGDGFTPTTADAFVTVRVAFVQVSTTTGGAS